ncbi:PPR domain-containing protein [Cephalotus follicularis]|uniref:PPR domain-containing protein n=1 Tax=Cephalotus follicularis TaxID=3775 RepID=A0A1Q3BQZ5_CEPFO|nr:PPR domain-containing protein [Cephalotus follicularis]
MMHGLCKEGLANKAYDLFRKIEENGCSLDGCSYNKFILGLLRNNDTSRAMQLLHEMVDKGYSTDASTAEKLVNMLVVSGLDDYTMLSCLRGVRLSIFNT